MIGDKMKTFENKVALITGASSGIGRATALAFAQEGARIILSDINVEAGEKLAAEIIKKFDKPAIFIKCDVSKGSEVANLIHKSIQHFGRIDYAFNNAGIEGAQAPTAECTEENWDRVINTNLKSVWLCMKQQIPQMLKQGGGSIVNCASIAGVVGFPGIPAYTASKHGIIGLTKAAALEYAKTGIRVNAVCPGVIQTAMIDRFTHGDPKAAEQLAAGEPIGRVGKPEEIANAVLWLCSDKASFVTGHPLIVDGGWVAQ
jgi:NAD(P)-dependent dehydrogenase (short-subunit alcohol dehydrogenase family)